jgi:hypothetical protein
MILACWDQPSGQLTDLNMYEVDHAQVLLSIDGIQRADANHSTLEKVMRMCVSRLSEYGGRG